MTVTDAPTAASIPTRLSSHLKPGSAAILLGIGFAWLAALLWTMRSALTESYGSDSALIFAAQNLFGPVTAVLAIGCTAGLTIIALYTRWRSSSETAPALWQRLLFGGLSGAITGIVIGAFALGIISDRRISAVYSVCLAAATTLGGLLSAVRPQRVVAAGIIGTYVTFAVKALLSPLSGTLAPLFGAKSTLEGSNAAGNRMLLAFSLLAGIAAGILVYRYLRQDSPGAIRWQGYMAAGSFAGLLALLAEAFTRLSAGKLLSPLTELSVVERTILALNGNVRINAGMVMLFAGGLTATLLLGRSMKNPHKA